MRWSRQPGIPSDNNYCRIASYRIGMAMFPLQAHAARLAKRPASGPWTAGFLCHKKSMILMRFVRQLAGSQLEDGWPLLLRAKTKAGLHLAMQYRHCLQRSTDLTKHSGIGTSMTNTPSHHVQGQPAEPPFLGRYPKRKKFIRRRTGWIGHTFTNVTTNVTREGLVNGVAGQGAGILVEIGENGEKWESRGDWIGLFLRAGVLRWLCLKRLNVYGRLSNAASRLEADLERRLVDLAMKLLVKTQLHS